MFIVISFIDYHIYTFGFKNVTTKTIQSWFLIIFNFPKWVVEAIRYPFHYPRKNSRTQVSSPNLTSSSSSVAPAVAKELRPKTSSETIAFCISQQGTSSEKNDKKAAKTLKWYKTSSRKASSSPLPWLWGCLKNVYPSTVTEDIFSTVFPETSKTGKSSRNSFRIL